MVIQDVTICIPTIPPRAALLARAIDSVYKQTVAPIIITVPDTDKEGACATRNKCLQLVATEFVGFLDDDDELCPRHVELLRDLLIKTGADLAYPLMSIVAENGGSIDPAAVFDRRPFAGFQWNPDRLLVHNFIPITVLARTKVLREAGGFEHLPGVYGEDHGMWLKLLYRGAKFAHLPVVTWRYNWHGANTHGQGGNW